MRWQKGYNFQKMKNTHFSCTTFNHFSLDEWPLVGLFLVQQVFKGDTIQELIIRTFLVLQVFKGDNHSREETIPRNTVCTTILS